MVGISGARGLDWRQFRKTEAMRVGARRSEGVGDTRRQDPELLPRY
jgi:hypothetical protein